MTKKIEFRVKPVTRYIVTRFESEMSETSEYDRDSVGVSSFGEYDNEAKARVIAESLLNLEMKNNRDWKHTGMYELEIY